MFPKQYFDQVPKVQIMNIDSVHLYNHTFSY